MRQRWLVESELPTSGQRPAHQGMPGTQGSSRRLVPGFGALWGVMASPVGAAFAEAPALESWREDWEESGEKKWVKKRGCVPVGTPRRPKL